LVACSAPTPGPGLRAGVAAEAPTTWLGAEPHLVLVGTVDGVAIQINVRGDDPLLSQLAGKREHQVLASGEKRYTAFEVSFGALMEGLERELELEFENADFGQVGLGTDLALESRANEELAPEGLAGPRSNLELEWEWEDPAQSKFASGEVLSSSGRLVRNLDAGPALGGWFNATFANGSVTGSFTVNNAEDEADDVDAFYR
jgi:hypothetical protein